MSIAVIGEYNKSFVPHHSIRRAVEHVVPVLALEWLDTGACEDLPTEELTRFDGFWIAPGSPYRSLVGALRIIEFARVNDVPLLGTCGGFQHIVLEFARDVIGFKDAAHAEYDPYSSNLFINKLQCSLAGQTMDVRISRGSMAHAAYGSLEAAERYYCDFGINPAYVSLLGQYGLQVSGVDQDGEARIVELDRLRFFVGTLFVPQVTSTQRRPHPIVRAFTKACTEFEADRPSQSG